MIQNSRGSITIHVALALIACLMFSGMVIDQGIMYVARSQAQNAADAGALAGAVALTHNESPANAVVSAQTMASQNMIWGQATSTADIVVPTIPFPCPKDGALSCVRVDVMRGIEDRDHNPHTNTIPTFLIRLAGPSFQGTRATATAQISAGNKTNCLRPWMIPDKWTEQSAPPNQTFNPGADLYVPPAPGNEQTMTGYKLSVDYGTVLTVKEGDSHDVIAPSDFYEIGPANTYEEAITSCQITAQIGDVIETRPGKRTGPTKHGTQELIDSDRNARWDGSAVVDSAFSLSPRIVPVAMFSPEEYYAGDKQSGTFPLHIVNVLGFFIISVDNQSTVTGVIVNDPGLFEASGGTVTQEAAFLKVIRLIR